jgi:hypothetical protein
VLPEPVLPSRAWPDVPPLGPTVRYAGMSPAELEVARRRLLVCANLWCEQWMRFRTVGVADPLGGPCAEALLAAARQLTDEMRAIVVEVEAQAAELRRGFAA